MPYSLHQTPEDQNKTQLETNARTHLAPKRDKMHFTGDRSFFVLGSAVVELTDRRSLRSRTVAQLPKQFDATLFIAIITQM